MRVSAQLRSVACYMTPVAAGMALPILTLPIMTRWLTPDDYGVVAVAQVVAALFTGVTSLGVSTGLERNFFKHEHDARALARVVHTAHALVVAGTVAGTALLVAGGDVLSQLLFGRPDRGLFLLAMAIASVLGVVVNMQLVYLRNRGRAAAYMTFSLVSIVVETGATLFLVIVAEAGVWGIPLGALAGKALVAAAGWLRLALELPPAIDRRRAGELLEIGLPLLPRAFVGVADNGVDRLSLNWLVSLGQAGYFGLANRIGYSVFSAMTSIEQLWVPQVYRMMFQGEDAGARIGRYITPYFYASLLLAVTAVLFVEEVLWVLVAPAFWPMKYVAAVLAAYYGQLFFGKIVGAQWIYLKKTWYATPVSLARLALHVALTLLLVGPLGALGAALALFLAGSVVDAVSLAIAQRQYRIAYETRFVVSVMVLLYVALVWVVVPAMVNVPYGLHLAVRLVVFGAFLALGGHRLAPLGAHIRGLARSGRGPVSAEVAIRGSH
jgi:O-antigen/teichoic acid export membrane protein